MFSIIVVDDVINAILTVHFIRKALYILSY